MSSGEIPQFRVSIARMSPVQRLAISLIALAGLAVGLIVIIPLAILMGVLGFAMLAWLRVRRWIAGDPSAREGRRNVRIIQRSN